LSASGEKKKRVVSGMRPTGKLHIGHYFGALENWVRLQNDPSFECFYFIADWHALTSDYADTSAVAQNTIEIVTDYLAAGLDPEKSVLFQQSLVPEHAELHLLLSMVTPLGWLERVPTYKEALENIKDKDLHNYGFLGYPVLQCADIVIYSSPDIAGLWVPVGEDQVSHVEASREIVRRFDTFYRPLFSERGMSSILENEGGFILPIKAKASELAAFNWKSATPDERRDFLQTALREQILEGGRENFVAKLPSEYRPLFDSPQVLAEPEAMLTKTPRIPGLDGRKMSKSYGNAILLSETDDDIRKKTKVMVTDPARKRRTDPGNPDVCPVYDWHKLFAPKDAAGQYTAEGKATLEWSANGCRTAGIGCIECKAAMAENLIKWIGPIRERRVEYEKNPARVLDVIDEGSKKARVEAQKTMARVREAVFGWEKKRAEIRANTTKVHDVHG
jgi:tryptophanyl-tRNA synthetase